jgi:predicted ester cyclase
MQNRATTEANHALVRKYIAAQDQLRGGPDPELCAPGYTARLGSGPTMDLAGHQASARGFYAGLPDMRHEIEQVIAEGDSVVVRFVIHGTHTQPLFGMPPSQRKVAIFAHVIFRVQDGKVKSLLGVFDEAGMLRQIGVLPG